MAVYDVIARLQAQGADAFTKAFVGANKAMTNLEKSSTSFKKVGAVVTAAGVGMAVGLGKSVKVAANFEAGMSKVGAVSGASGKDMDLLTAKAREMGSKTSFSASEAANGLEYMALAGWDTTQMMGGLEPILHLAEAGALDLGRASDLVTDSMSSMGIEVQDLDGYLDKVAQTSRNSNTDIDALMEAFVVAGGTFKRLNVPLEESNAFLGVLANRGTKGGEAGTALNAIMTRLTASTGPAADALEEMGISAYDSEGNFRGMEVVMKDVEKATASMTDKEKAHYINMLAGLNHGKSFEKMLSGLGDEYDDLKDSITNSDGALKEMRDEMKDNLQGALENLSSAFEDIQIELGNALLPTIKKVTAILQSLADKFNGLDESTKQTIAKLIALTTAVMLVIGPLLMLVGFLPSIAAGFGHIWTVITTLSKGFMFLGKIIRPIIALFKLIGVVIAGLSTPVLITIAVIIAAAALIYVYWEPVKAFFLSLWDGIKEVATLAFSAIVTVVTSAWDIIKSVWDTVLEFYINLWDGIKETAISLWESVTTVWTSFVETVKEIFKPLTDFFVELWESVKTTTVEIWDNITSTLSDVWNSIKTIASQVWELVKLAVLTPILLLIQLLTGNMEGLRSTLTQVWEKIRAAGSKIWEALKSALLSIVEGLSNNVKSVFNFLKTSISDIFTAIKTTAINLWEQLKTNLLRIASFIKTSVVDKFQQLKSDAIKKVTQTVTDMLTKWGELASKTLGKMKEVVRNVVDTLKGIDLKQIGKDVINGFIDGIKSRVGAVADAAKSAADAVTGKIKGILGIKSPSRVLMAMGDDTGEGYEIGLLGRIKGISKASDAMANAAKIDVDDNELTSQIAFANNDVKRALTSDIESSVTVNKQAAMINLDLGGTSYRAFVDDITATQGYKADLVKRF